MTDLDEKCELTPEQRAFLEECNEEFINRYTFKDEDYKNSYDRDITKPPIVSPWHGRSRMNFNRPGNRNYNQGRQYDKDRYNSYENRYNRNNYNDKGFRRDY